MTDTPKKPSRILPPMPPPAPARRPLAPVPADGGGEGKPEAERKTPDPTRFGDWEKNGRCIDF
jgi:hypothetical protein